MIRPLPPQPTWLHQASNTRRWLATVAERQGISPAVAAREYRTVTGLARPIAAIIREYCHREAIRLVREDEPAPRGADLLDRTIACYHTRYQAIKAAHERAGMEATVKMVRAMQGEQP